jgi:hypothetical protein
LDEGIDDLELTESKMMDVRGELFGRAVYGSACGESVSIRKTWELLKSFWLWSVSQRRHLRSPPAPKPEQQALAIASWVLDLVALK